MLRVRIRRVAVVVAPVLALSLLPGSALARPPAAVVARAPAANLCRVPVDLTFPPDRVAVADRLGVGRHATFDRVVLGLSGRAAGYQVRYVPRLTQDGSGFPVDLRGR